MHCLASFALLLSLPSSPVTGVWDLEDLPFPPYRLDGSCWCVGDTYQIFRGSPPREVLAWRLRTPVAPQCGRRNPPLNIHVVK